MPRRRVALLVLTVVGAVLAACRDSTVSVAFRPEVGSRYEYRYEIEATVTRGLEGQPPEVLEVDTELVAVQEVVAVTRSGIRARVELAREGGVTRTAVVVLDRAGSLEGVELVDDLDAAVFGVDGGGTLAPTDLPAPPDRPLSIGERWRVGDDEREAHGRLDRLGIVDGNDVAVVSTRSSEAVDRRGRAAASRVRLRGTAEAGATTTYDLADGAVRRSRSWSRGALRAELGPPAGIDAAPVPATITYEVIVRVTRIGP